VPAAISCRKGSSSREVQVFVDPTGRRLRVVRAARPYLFEMTFLHATARGVLERGTFAFDPQIAPIGEEAIAEAAEGNPTASYAVGAYILWRLDDPENARPYLEIAGEAGVPDALIDLAVLELLSA